MQHRERWEKVLDYAFTFTHKVAVLDHNLVIKQMPKTEGSTATALIMS